ncbi:hypothetical protein Tco_0532806 [Tanacetum coccineum]
MGPSPDYIPGPDVPPSPDYIHGPEGPPSPDYVPRTKEPEQAPPSPVYLPYVPEPVYPEYIPPEDDVFLAEEQPLHAATSPTAESPGYIPESDPEEDPEEDPADYPADREDDDDDEDEDEDGEEEEEHPAPADSVPPGTRRETSCLNHPTTITQIPSPPLPIPSPPPNSPTHIEIPESCLPLRKRVRFTSPTPSHEVGENSAAGATRQDRPAIAKDDPYSIAREDLYGFVDMVDDDLVGAIDEIAPTTLEGVNQRVTDLATIVEQETTIMYGIMEDARDDRSQLRGRCQMLYRMACSSADHRRQRLISVLVGIRPQETSSVAKTLRFSERTTDTDGRVSDGSKDPQQKSPAQPDWHQERLWVASS